ncbi:MAG: hypothetical protein WC464_04505 [Bdellovibrionales bacterium]
MILKEISAEDIVDAFEAASYEATRGHTAAAMIFLDLFSNKARMYPGLSSPALIKNIMRLSDKISSRENFLTSYEGNIFQAIHPALCGIAAGRPDLLAQDADFRRRLEMIGLGNETRRIGIKTVELAIHAINKPVEYTTFPPKAYPRAPYYTYEKIPEYETRLARINASVKNDSDENSRYHEISEALKPFLDIAENDPVLLSDKAKLHIKAIRDKAMNREGCILLGLYYEADTILVVAKQSAEFPNTRPMHKINNALRRLPDISKA